MHTIAKTSNIGELHIILKKMNCTAHQHLKCVYSVYNKSISLINPSGHFYAPLTQYYMSKYY
jgi:hypothetical protein